MSDPAVWNLDQPAQRASAGNGRPEGKNANRALRDYLILGPTRSLAGLLAQYQLDSSAPTHSAGTLQTWADLFCWPQRALRFDRLQSEGVQIRQEDQRSRVLSSGFALAHERIQKLESLLAQVEQFLQVAQRLTYESAQDISQQGGVERVAVILRSAAPLFGQARGMLNDLARETSARARAEPAIENTPPDFSRLSDAEVDTLVDLLHKAEPAQPRLL